MSPCDRPRLRPAARLRHDRARDRWVILAPERGYVLNESARKIVERLDGRTSIEELGRRIEEAQPEHIEALLRRLDELGLLERRQPARAP